MGIRRTSFQNSMSSTITLTLRSLHVYRVPVPTPFEIHEETINRLHWLAVQSLDLYVRTVLEYKKAVFSVERVKLKRRV
jgi:hypothetical protein